VKRVILVLAALFVLALIVKTGFFVVDRGEAAVVTQFGKPVRVVDGPGVYLKAPLPVQVVRSYDQRLRVWDSEAREYATSDSATVVLTTYAAWRIRDARAFAEIRRVLAPGGMTIFSVPLSGRDETIERARATPEGIVHLLPPEYHGDRLRGRRAVLAYRTYGRDIVARVLAAGFRRAFLDTVDEHAWLGHGRQIVVAMR